MAFVVSDSLWPYRPQTTRLLCPWDFPGKNIGLPLPSPGVLPEPGTESTSLKSLALAGGFLTTSATWQAHFLYWEPQNGGCPCGPHHKLKPELAALTGNVHQGNLTGTDHNPPAHLSQAPLTLESRTCSPSRKAPPHPSIWPCPVSLLPGLTSYTLSCANPQRRDFTANKALDSPSSFIILPWIKDIKLITKLVYFCHLMPPNCMNFQYLPLAILWDF